MAGFFVGCAMVDLSSDCKNCAALCCVALAFDKGAMFAFSKAAGVPCPHLKGHSCGIHPDLEAKGLKGCVQYQCDGAGQRVMKEVFPGQTWRDEPELLGPMMAAFSSMRKVHGQLVLLKAAEALSLSVDQRAELKHFRQRLAPEAGWSEEALEKLEKSGIFRELASFFQALQPLV